MMCGTELYIELCGTELYIEHSGCADQTFLEPGHCHCVSMAAATMYVRASV